MPTIGARQESGRIVSCDEPLERRAMPHATVCCSPWILQSSNQMRPVRTWSITRVLLAAPSHVAPA